MRSWRGLQKAGPWHDPGCPPPPQNPFLRIGVSPAAQTLQPGVWCPPGGEGRASAVSWLPTARGRGDKEAGPSQGGGPLHAQSEDECWPPWSPLWEASRLPGSELLSAQLSTDLTAVWCPRSIQGAPEHELEPGGTARSGLSRLLLGRAREQTFVTWQLCRPDLLCLDVSTPHGISRPLQMIDREEMCGAVSMKLCLQTLKSRSHDFHMLPNIIIFLF